MRYALENQRQAVLTPNLGTTSLKPTVGRGPAGPNTVPTHDAIGSDLTTRGLPTSGTALSASYVVKEREGKNILDVPGVSVGMMDDCGPAINQAFLDNPDTPFRFPVAGPYRTDEKLVVTTGNSLVGSPGATVTAGAAMDKLLDWDNGATGSAGFARGPSISNLTFNANLLAENAFEIGGVLKATVEDIRILDAVKKGFVAKALGAELTVSRLNVTNTGTTNVTGNVGAEILTHDTTLHSLVTRDCTTGIRDHGGNVYIDAHPWLGNGSQLTARYPTGVGIELVGNSPSIFVGSYSDTYRYNYRSAATTGYAQAVFFGPRAFSNNGNLSNALAAANPGRIFDIVDGGKIVVFGGDYQGHNVTPHAFVGGVSTRFTARPEWFNRIPGSVSGLVEYKNGVQLGITTFNPTVFGSVSGGLASSTVQTGTMSVADGMVTYIVRVTGVVAASGVSGNLRIGVPAYPTGATALNTGVVTIGTSTGIDANGGNGGGVTASPVVIRPTKSSGGVTSEVNLGALMGSTIEFTITMVAPFTYPN